MKPGRWLRSCAFILGTASVRIAAAQPATALATAEPSSSIEEEFGDAASDAASEEVGSQPFEIYGFADVNFVAPFWSPHATYSVTGLGSHPYFSVGNFNVYLSKNLEQNWHFLGEVRFMYAPNGASDPANPGTRLSTQVGDTADLDRQFRWGTIEIERLHVDYRHSSLFSLRFGQWLTPYGIWNIDHGSPALTAIQRPYIVGEQLFPEQQTGIQAFGDTFVGDLRLGYALGISNGRGPMDQQRDLDSNKALTGRVEVSYDRFGDWRAGASYYRGRYTSSSFPVADPIKVRADTTVLEQYEEQAVGADLKWDYENFLLRSEFAYSERWYAGGVRRSVRPGQVYPDRRRFGVYGLIGYKTPVFGLTPYAVVQDYLLGHEPGLPQIDNLRGYHAGLNLPIGPSVTAKGEYLHVNFPGSKSPLVTKGRFHLVQFQLSVAF